MKKDLILRVAVDAGNSTTNVVTEGLTFDFDSMLQENQGTKIEDAENTIFINGKHYTVGQGDITAATAAYRDMEKYETLVAYAIANTLKKKEIDTNEVNVTVFLGIGLPTSDYATLKENYRYQFNGDGAKEYNVRLNKTNMSFKITEVRVLPQASVIPHSYKELFKDVINKGFIVDFGSISVDLQEVGPGGVLIKENRHSSELGMFKIIDKVREVLKEGYGVAISDDKTIERAIKNDKIMGMDGAWIHFSEDNAIQDIYANTVEKIYNEFRMRFDIGISEKTVAIGGGAIPFKQYILKKFNNAEIMKNPQYKNAEAYYKFIGGK